MPVKRPHPAQGGRHRGSGKGREMINHGFRKVRGKDKACYARVLRLLIQKVAGLPLPMPVALAIALSPVKGLLERMGLTPNFTAVGLLRFIRRGLL